MKIVRSVFVLLRAACGEGHERIQKEKRMDQKKSLHRKCHLSIINTRCVCRL